MSTKKAIKELRSRGFENPHKTLAILKKAGIRVSKIKTHRFTLVYRSFLSAGGAKNALLDALTSGGLSEDDVKLSFQRKRRDVYRMDDIVGDIK